MAHDPKGTLDLAGRTIETLPNPGSRGNAGRNTAHFTRVAGDIFPNPPAVGDVKQQALADCYVLAAVLAILAQPQGPDTVEGMMRDRGADVVVRLYDAKNVAHYVAIEKSIRRNDEKHNGGALWATLLEKAYAAAAFVEENKLESGKPATSARVRTGYAKLDRGDASDAMQVLLGAAGEKKGIAQNLIDATTGGRGNQLRRIFTLDQRSAIEMKGAAVLIAEVFGGDGKQFNEFLQWRTDLVRASWDTLLDAHGDVTSSIGPSTGKGKKSTPTEPPRRTLRLEDLDAFLRTHALAPEIVDRVIGFAERHQLLPGRRGTGIYTKAQTDWFDRIRTALAQHKPVALGTTKTVGFAVSGKGKSGGEELVKGLAGGHAYAVLAVREDAGPPARKWIRVRNPWGEEGRSYVAAGPSAPNVLKAVRMDAGEFDVELSDLTKRFSNLYVGGALA